MNQVQVVAASAMDMNVVIDAWGEKKMGNERDYDSLFRNNLAVQTGTNVCIPDLPCPTNWTCVPNFPCPQKGKCFCPGGQ